MNSGNGANVSVGALQIQNATLVLGPEGSGTATLMGTIFNNGDTDDRLVGVSINAGNASITPGAEVIPAQSSVAYGYAGPNFINTYALQVEPSAFVPVTFAFERAGLVEAQVMTVPAVGIYEGIAPNPPTAS